MTTTIQKFTKRLFLAALAASAVLSTTEQADAQEILLTGPLAGAPAVRKLRLYRQGRFEIAPAVTFSLLDEYQRTIFLGARLQYNLTDWLGIGAWGAYGGLININTALTDHIQEVNGSPARTNGGYLNSERRLTAVNLGPNFEDQLGSIDWIVAPQITAVPFRGKLALFQGIYVDTDLYAFAGPAIMGLTERADCGGGGSQQSCAPGPNVAFEMASRTAIAPTFGIGLSFFVNKWSAIGFEWRFLPFSMNTGGFDTAGGGQDEEYPDNKITDADRGFAFRQLLTLSYNIFLPTQNRISE
jgi:hypothetical protein